jgi:hypothetical protein
MPETSFLKAMIVIFDKLIYVSNANKFDKKTSAERCGIINPEHEEVALVINYESIKCFSFDSFYACCGVRSQVVYAGSRR